MVAAIVVIFAVGYACIAFEHTIRINKAASALAAGILAWTVYIIAAPDTHGVIHGLKEHFENIAEILFFLLGAMTIVELVDAHGGFEVITTRIRTRKKRVLLWILGVIAFILSAVLDNLTTTIVMISLVRKIIEAHDERLLYAGIIVIAANAGGAWSPIGDVTTTMLWIGGNISTLATVKTLLLPSIACLVLPLIIITPTIRGRVGRMAKSGPITADKIAVFVLGLGALLFTPVFKTITHLPPFTGMLFGLSVLWITTEIMHRGKAHEYRSQLSVARALQRIDSASVLFFLGILLCIGALDAVGVLSRSAQFLADTIGNETAIVALIGVISAVVDNVPLVAAAMGMYPLTVHQPDSSFWQLLAYCAGTGGSMLVIGSAAGVAAMGMEKIDFLWYLKRISPLALFGYAAGIAVFLGERALFPGLF